MASALIRRSRGVLEAGMTWEPTSINISSFRTRGLFRARVDHQRLIAEALESIVPFPILAMRRSAVFADYVTSIRDIVAAEDMHEVMQMQKERTGRTTRNSGGSYVRNIALTAEERTALGASVLEGF